MNTKKFYLALEKGSLQKTLYPLSETATIGRSPDNTISLPDPTVSRHHARVSNVEGVWTIEDLGSANGIIAAGKRIERMVLQPGSTFQIGGITFRFQESSTSDRGNHLYDTVEILSASIQGEALQPADQRAEPWLERLQGAIAAIPFFSSLEPAEHQKLASAASLHVFNEGEIIIREGDPGRSIYVILDGQVKVFTRDYQGKEVQLAILGVSRFFGEMSFLSGKPRSSSVAALGSTVVIELGYTSMRKLVQQHPAVRQILLDYYHHRLRESEERRAEVGIKDRRRHPRFKERLPVKLVAVPAGEAQSRTAAESCKGVSLDISLSGTVVGVAASSAVCLEGARELRLEVGLPPPWNKIRTLGTVRRMQPAARDKKMTLVAVEFTGMSIEDKKGLRMFLYGETHMEPEA